MRWIRCLTFAVGFSGIFMVPLHAQELRGTITGHIVSTGGAPLAGAQVDIPSEGIGVISNTDGRYVLVAPVGTHEVHVTMLGYSSRTQTVTVTAGGTVVADFELPVEAVALDELVVVGYGSTTRRDLTGAVSSISGDELELKAAPVQNLSSLLEGKAAGAQVTINSGVPGAAATVRIRGSNSITASSEPLFVIDGIPAAQAGNSRNPTSNPLNALDPNDIESIEILKDAASTAIYGARGANGVVLITTKRGRRGENTISLESSYGWQEVARPIDVLTAPQFRELANEAYVNGGGAAPYTEINVPSYDYPEMIMRTGAQQNQSLTISGGDDRTAYLVAGNYSEIDGILVNTNFRRYGARLNLDRTVSDWFQIGTSMSLTNLRTFNTGQSDGGGLVASSSGVGSALQIDPAQAPKDDDGNWIPVSIGLSEQVPNPLSDLEQTIDINEQTRFLGNVSGELGIMEGLQLRGRAGANIYFATNNYFTPSTTYDGSGVNGSASVNDIRGRELTGEVLGDWSTTFGPGGLNVLGGATIQTSKTDNVGASATDLLSPTLTYKNLSASGTRGAPVSGETEWTLLSYLTRVNYNIADRYLFTVSARADGSSRFAKNNKWGYFPSASFAWRVSDESFMQDRALPFSDLKLRLAWGRTGNQAIAPYQSLATLTQSRYHIGPGTGVGSIGLYPSSQAPNPDLKWETLDEINVGVDFGLLNNRVVANLDLYRKETSDLLLTVPLPQASGYSSQTRNIGSVRNTGLEVTLNTVNVDRPSFGWRSTLNIAFNRNEVVDLGADEQIFPGTRSFNFIDGGETHIVKVGEELGSIYGFESRGLYQEGDACPLAEASQCTPGEIKFVDQNGDGVIDLDDRTILGSSNPDFYGGINNTLSLGRFTVDAYMTFSHGAEVINAGRMISASSRAFLNEYVEVLDRWTSTNTNTDVPRANTARVQRVYSRIVEDASFLRLQTLTVGFNVPDGWVPGTRTARLYVTGQNLFVLTGYKGYDPEVSSLGTDARVGGLDMGAYPRARTFNVGVNVTF